MGAYKEKYGKTRFGKFLEKAGNVVPDVVNVVGKLATGDVSGALQEVGNVLGSKAQESEEAKALLIEFEKYKMEYQKEMYALLIEETKSARENETQRDISENSSWLTKNIHEIIALCVVSGWLVTWYFKPKIEYADITEVVTLILGYLYGRTRPQN